MDTVIYDTVIYDYKFIYATQWVSQLSPLSVGQLALEQLLQISKTARYFSVLICLKLGHCKVTGLTEGDKKFQRSKVFIRVILQYFLHFLEDGSIIFPNIFCSSRIQYPLIPSEKIYRKLNPTARSMSRMKQIYNQNNGRNHCQVLLECWYIWSTHKTICA